MYIRRKVFSVAVDENGEERYFSTNEIINEEDYLDEVMYNDLGEREFAKTPAPENFKNLIDAAKRKNVGIFDSNIDHKKLINAIKARKNSPVDVGIFKEVRPKRPTKF